MTDTVVDRIVDKLMMHEIMIPINHSVEFYIGGTVIEETIIFINDTRVVLVSLGDGMDMGVCMAHIYLSELLDDTGVIDRELTDCYWRVKPDKRIAYATYEQNLKSFKNLLRSLSQSNRLNLPDDYEPEIKVTDLDPYNFTKIQSVCSNMKEVYNNLYAGATCESIVYYGDEFATIFYYIIYDELDKFHDGKMSNLLKIEVDSKVKLAEGDGEYWQHVDVEPVYVFGELHIAFRLKKYSSDGNNDISVINSLVDVKSESYYTILSKMVTESRRIFGLVSSETPVHSVKIVRKEV